jgi:hypothetical protein
MRKGAVSTGGSVEAGVGEERGLPSAPFRVHICAETNISADNRGANSSRLILEGRTRTM